MRIIDLQHRVAADKMSFHGVIKHHTHDKMNMSDPGLVCCNGVEVGVYVPDVVLIHQSDRFLPHKGVNETGQEMQIKIISHLFVVLAFEPHA